jgi:hypothetical protein
MGSLEDWLTNLEQAEPTEDRTAHVRETHYSLRRVDYEIVENTSFSKGYPETNREVRLRRSLDCGHHVTENNPFGGYCQGGGVRTRPCSREYCAKCAVQCPYCGICVSAECHATSYEGTLVCRSCGRRLRTRRALRTTWELVIHPFVAEEDDV